MAEIEQAFEGWAILELMGHRRLAGYLQEAQIAGASFIRIDIYQTAENANGQDSYFTQFYAPSAVYAITPVLEGEARAIANIQTYMPIHAYELRRTLPAGRREHEDDHPDMFYDDEHK